MHISILWIAPGVFQGSNIFTSSDKFNVMKMRWIFAVCFVFLFASLACVGAADNVTFDNSTQDEVLGEPQEIVEDINVTFDEKMWRENLSDIHVELPEEASGEFCIKIDDEAIHNETITDHSFNVSIKLPKPKFIYIANIYPPMDMKTYKVSAFYNGIDLNISRTLKVMSYPPDFEIMNFPEEILHNKDHQVMLMFPRSASGMVEIYIDDRLIERSFARPIISWESDPFSNLALGKHNATIRYLGDDYYRPFNRTFNFTVTNVKISIPRIVNISHDDCISVEAQSMAPGTVKVYVDGTLVKSQKVYDGEFIFSLEGYVKYTSREVKVLFEGKSFSRTKTQSVRMAYDFDAMMMDYIYGDKNTIEVILPDTLNSRLLTISINGTNYPFKRPQNTGNNIAEVDISKLDAGNYSMLVSFKGDDTFYALNRTYNFTVNYDFHIPDEIEYRDSSKITLKLPADADGNLTVYVNGSLFKSVKLSKGYGEVRMDSLAPGMYNLSVRYDGSDYAVGEANVSFTVLPKIDMEYVFTAGEDKYVTVEVPKTTRGYVVFDIDGRTYKVTIRDGIAKCSLKNLNAGEYDLFIDYYGADGFKDLSNWRTVTVNKAKLSLVSVEATFKGINVKMKLLTRNGKALAYKDVVIKFNGKTYKVKTNGKGVLTFKKSMKVKGKKSTLKITYMGAKLTKKLKVKPISIKASKSKKKLVVKAFISKKIKNKIIKIKVNSKKFTLKTNRKGMVKLTVKKPKKTATVKATYLKSTVKVKV